MRPVVWSANAIESIQNSYNYIYLQSPKNADLVVETLFDLGDKLNLFPEKKSNRTFIQFKRYQVLSQMEF